MRKIAEEPQKPQAFWFPAQKEGHTSGRNLSLPEKHTTEISQLLQKREKCTVFRGSHPSVQLLRSTFTHLEVTSSISKAPVLLIQWRPAGALGFDDSSLRAAEPLGGPTLHDHSSHLSPPFFFRLKEFLVPSLPSSHCPFTSTKPYKTTSLGDLVHRWQEQSSRLL